MTASSSSPTPYWPGKYCDLRAGSLCQGQRLPGAEHERNRRRPGSSIGNDEAASRMMSEGGCDERRSRGRRARCAPPPALAAASSSIDEIVRNPDALFDQRLGTWKESGGSGSARSCRAARDAEPQD